MLDKAKEAAARRAMSGVTPSETDMGQAFAKIIAGLESEQAEAIDRLLDATDDDRRLGHDRDAREEEVLETIDAIAQGSLPELVIDRWGLDNCEQAVEFVGIDRDEWRQQKREWFESYRDRGIVEGPESIDDENLPEIVDETADRHLRSVFGIDLDTFESRIVEWDRGREMQDLLAGPTVTHTEVINQVADSLEHDS